MDFNYYNYETPYYDTPNDDKYINITNVSQVRNYYIKQPSSNEFIFKCNKVIWGVLAFFLLSSGFLSLLICIAIFDFGGESNPVGLIFGIAFTGFLTVFSIFSLFFVIIRQKVILTEYNIQIKTYYLFFCFNSNKIYEYINIKGFQVDTIETNGEKRTVKKDYKIICIDNSNEKMLFFEHNFELEEAEYFVYVVNDFINKKKNLPTLS